jgi:hypothetical protein
MLCGKPSNKQMEAMVVEESVGDVGQSLLLLPDD